MLAFRTLAVFSIMLVLFASGGCEYFRQPVTEDIRAKFGKRIGVVSSKSIPVVDIDSPAEGSGEGAGRGIIHGAGAGFSGTLSGVGLGGCGPDPICGAVILLQLAAIAVGTTVGAIVGGIHGVVTAEDAITVEQIEVGLHKVLTALDMQEVLKQQVVLEAKAQTPYDFVDLNPSTFSQELAGSHEKSSTRTVVDTVMEVGIETIGLEGPDWEINPPLAILMTARIRMVQPNTKEVLFEAAFPYRSYVLKFAEWGDKDAQLFREGLNAAYQQLATQIVEELFLLYRSLGSEVFETTEKFMVQED
jgi:hypothetical protein